MIAFQASKGALSGYIQRYMNALPDSTRGDLKGELAKRFSDSTDLQFALGMLRQTKQKKGENVQMYAERILSLAEEAFLGQGGDAIERQLIDTFVDGLTNEGLKMTILRKKNMITCKRQSLLRLTSKIYGLGCICLVQIKAHRNQMCAVHPWRWTTIDIKNVTNANKQVILRSVVGMLMTM